MKCVIGCVVLLGADPFLKLGLVYGEEGRIVGKDHTVKTGVVKKTLNPDWDEIITFRSTGYVHTARTGKHVHDVLLLVYPSWRGCPQ